MIKINFNYIVNFLPLLSMLNECEIAIPNDLQGIGVQLVISTKCKKTIFLTFYMIYRYVIKIHVSLNSKY